MLPAPAVPSLDGSDHVDKAVLPPSDQEYHEGFAGKLPSAPLGLGPSVNRHMASLALEDSAARSQPDQLPAPYKATYLPLVDRLAARERAFTLLSGLTRLGTGWDNSDAWFALARAHEESGQPEKAKEVLWWCVELEEAMGVREWRCLGNGGYII